ncbi:MAG: FAD-binding oxidoreductase [Desulfotomaculaceae bacterium]
MLSDAQINGLVTYLSGVVGEKYVTVSTFEKIKNALDPFPYTVDRGNLPHVIVMPETKEQISKIMEYANNNKTPVFVRGSGTQLAGSSRPHVSGITINTRRMNKFWVIEEDGYFEAEPGVRCGDIADFLQKKGYLLPILPGSKIIASLGGLISNNTSGHVIDPSIGKLSDYVLGLEVVLPNGDIIETGTRGLRKPAGTDLTKFFVGGDGLLGVVTKIRMRLLPLLPQAYGIAVFKGLPPIARGVKNMYLKKCPPPLFMEFMDENVTSTAYQAKEMTPPPGAVILFVGIGQDKAEAEKKMGLVMDVFREENPIEAYPVTDLEEWKKIWGAREVIAPYLMNSLQGKLIAAEVVSTLSRLEECMRDGANFNVGVPYLEELTNYFFGHIGALTMHPTFILPTTWDDEKMRRTVDEHFKKERQLNLKYNTCGGEWGQFSKRTPFFKQRYGDIAYGLVKNLKATFDPNNILNPGILEGYR